MPHYHDCHPEPILPFRITNLEERKAAYKQNQRHTQELRSPQRPFQIRVFQIRAWRSREGRLPIGMLGQHVAGLRLEPMACASLANAPTLNQAASWCNVLLLSLISSDLRDP